jgi:hypothetical protein
MWTGSLPNLTLQLTTQQQTKDTFKKKNDPYATFADNLNHIDIKETITPIPKRVGYRFLKKLSSQNNIYS